MRQLAQHELHDLAGLGCGDDEADHALDGRIQPRASPAASPFGPSASALSAWLATACDRLDDEVGAGGPQPFLAAEMIGDRADIGVGRRGDLARRGAVEALAAEQPQRGTDERLACLLGGGLRGGVVGFAGVFMIQRFNQSID